MSIFYTFDDFVLLDEALDFDKFMDDICADEDDARERLNENSNNDSLRREYSLRYCDTPSNKLRVVLKG